MSASVQPSPRLPSLHPAADLVYSGFGQLLQLELRDIEKLGTETLIPNFILKTLDDLINEAISTFRENYKSALMEVDQDVVIIGDLHGNLTDLMRLLLANGLPPQTSYLFLGDFVDRGDFSIEVISLILALLVLFPHNIFIIRGNHELREINRTYGFHDEIEKQYGEEDLWEHINSCIEYIPIAAVVKEKYYCVHGGITKNLSVSALKSIELPLTKLNNMLTDLLWSDPNEAIESYTSNPRGTGIEFGFLASLAFLKQNNLDWIVRGHQCIKEGVNIKNKMNVITVFSSSRYQKDARPNVCGFLIIKENNGFEKFSFPDIPILDRENANFFKVMPDSNLQSPDMQQSLNRRSMISLTSKTAQAFSFSTTNTRKILQQPVFGQNTMSRRGSIIRLPSKAKISIPNVQGGLQSVRAVSRINAAKIAAVQVPVPDE